MIPLNNIKKGIFTSFKEIEKNNPLQFTTIAEFDSPINNLMLVNGNSLFMYPDVNRHKNFIQF